MTTTGMQVHHYKVELLSIKMTRTVFKQFEDVGLEDVKHLMREGEFGKECVLGWIHGAVIGEEFRKYLIIQLKPGKYVRFSCMESTAKRHDQIYLG